MSKNMLVTAVSVVLLISAGYIFFLSYQRSFSRNRLSNRATPTGAVQTMLPSVKTATYIVSRISSQELILTKEGKTTTFSIPKNIRIVRQEIVIPYLLKHEKVPSGPPATLADITPGSMIQLSTVGEMSEVSAITIPRIPYVVEGVVKSISGDSLTVDGVPVLETNPGPLSEQKHTTYTVKVTDETEISRQPEGQGGTPGMIKQYTLGTIPLDTRVIIYAMTDVTTHSEVTAARVEPIL